MSLVGLLRRNIVVVITIPTLVAIHYAWYNLQFNDLFVDKQSRESTKILGFHISKPEDKSPKTN
jgi:hypothetical protein